MIETAFQKSSVLWLVITALMLCQCSMINGYTDRYDQPAKILQSEGFIEKRFSAGPFEIYGWQRIHPAATDLHIYFEGDGFAWITARTQSGDPTPINPVAARLAATDPASNVIWLARPCQYVAHRPGWQHCDPKYWSLSRYAPEIVNAINTVIDQIVQNRKPIRLHFIGYSGGAAIAALLAAQRKDIASLRTIAGNLDIDVFARENGITSLRHSLNPANTAKVLATIPQRHLVGAKDRIIPDQVVESWRRATASDHCLEILTYDNLGHAGPWLSAWAEDGLKPLYCGKGR